MSVGRWCPIQQMMCWDYDCSEGCEITHEPPTATTPDSGDEQRPGVDELVAAWKAALAEARIGWIVDDEGKLWPPHDTHGGTCGHPHNYDGSCAICRCGDRPEALDALLRFLAGTVPSPVALDRESLGRVVREVWIEWAKEQPSPKDSWLVPWEGLSEPDREVDRRIGERLAAIGRSASPVAPVPPADDPARCDRCPVWDGGDCGGCYLVDDAPAPPADELPDVVQVPRAEWEALRAAVRFWDTCDRDKQRGAMGDTALAGARLIAAADRLAAGADAGAPSEPVAGGQG